MEIWECYSNCLHQTLHIKWLLTTLLENTAIMKTVISPATCGLLKSSLNSERPKDQFLISLVKKYQRLKTWWLLCQMPGFTGSALGLVGLVLTYHKWVKWPVWSAISTSERKHTHLSPQICPWDTLACCRDVQQANNKQKSLPKRQGQQKLLAH